MRVDRKDTKIVDAINAAPVYRKTVQVRARPAIGGERVVTHLSGGVEETFNTTEDGDMVITNPGGEQYIVKPAMFADRYEESGTPGVYNAKGKCRAILNPFNEPVEILASWGKVQHGDASCMFADTCDAEGKTDGEPYLIGAQEFANTYARI